MHTRTLIRIYCSRSISVAVTAVRGSLLACQWYCSTFLKLNSIELTYPFKIIS